MKKSLKLLLMSILCILICSTVFVGCSFGNKYTFNFYVDEDLVYTYNSKDIKVQYPENPEMIGYEFDGWEKDVEKSSKNCYVYYAKFSKKKYTINFYVNDVKLDYFQVVEFTSSLDKSLFSEDFKIILTENDTLIDNWKINDSEEIFTLDTVLTEDIVKDLADNNINLYATKSKFSVNLDANNGEEKSKIDVLYNQNYSLPIPTKINYVFLGWYYGDVKYTDELGNSLKEYNDVANLTLIAKWEKVKSNYKIEYYFEQDNGEFAINSTYTQNLSNNINSEVVADIISVENFVFDEDNANNVLNATLTYDDTTTLKVYYKKIISTTLFFADKELLDADGYKFIYDVGNYDIFLRNSSAWTQYEDSKTIFTIINALPEIEFSYNVPKNFILKIDELTLNNSLITTHSFESSTSGTFVTNENAYYFKLYVTRTTSNFTPNDITVSAVSGLHLNIASHFSSDVVKDVTLKFVSGKSIALISPYYTGYDFCGWYLSPDFSGEQITTITREHNGLTLYPKYKGIEYTLTINPNGGTYNGSTSSFVATTFVKVHSSSPILLDYDIIKENYELAGYTNAQGSKGSVSQDSETGDWYFNPGFGNSTINAKFEVVVSTVSLLIPFDYGVFDIISKNGKDWIQGDDDKIIKTTIPAIPNYKYYFQYSSDFYLYLEQFDANGNSLVYTQFNVEQNESTGYYDGSILSNPKAEYFEISVKRTSDYDLHPDHIANSMFDVLHFNPYGLIKSGDNAQIIEVDGKFYFNIEHPLTKEINLFGLYECYNRYEFLGWYDNEEFLGEAITKLNASTLNKTLYPKFKELNYSFYVNLNGGECSLFEDGYKLDMTEGSYYFELAGVVPTKQGYTFVRWSYDGRGGFDTTGNLIVANSSKNATLTAIWEINSYTITLNSTGVLDNRDIKVNYNNEYVLPEELKEGYTFDGWYDNSNYSGEKITSIIVTDNVVFYAKFTAKEIVLTIDPNNLEQTYTETITPNATLNLTIPENGDNTFSGFEYVQNVTTWDGETLTEFSGLGTKNNPYLISNAENLAYLANSVKNGNNYENCYFIQTANIDLGLNEWTPIGLGYDLRFSGNFDGNNFEIYGLNLSNTYKVDSTDLEYLDKFSYTGLFGFVYGKGSNVVIQNIRIVDAILTIDKDFRHNEVYEGDGTRYNALLIGCAQDVTIFNCVVNGEISVLLENALYEYKDVDNNYLLNFYKFSALTAYARGTSKIVNNVVDVYIISNDTSLETISLDDIYHILTGRQDLLMNETGVEYKVLVNSNATFESDGYVEPVFYGTENIVFNNGDNYPYLYGITLIAKWN